MRFVADGDDAAEGTTYLTVFMDEVDGPGGSLTHLAGTLSNKPATRNNHTAQSRAEPAHKSSALKPLALGVAPSRNGVAADYRSVHK
jgi:hypothetical protein